MNRFQGFQGVSVALVQVRRALQIMLKDEGEKMIGHVASKNTIPDVAWWDASLFEFGFYPHSIENLTDDILRVKMITIYMEHPLPVEPPVETAPPPPQWIKRTKGEWKSLGHRGRTGGKRKGGR